MAIYTNKKTLEFILGINYRKYNINVAVNIIIIAFGVGSSWYKPLKRKYRNWFWINNATWLKFDIKLLIINRFSSLGNFCSSLAESIPGNLHIGSLMLNESTKDKWKYNKAYTCKKSLIRFDELFFSFQIGVPEFYSLLTNFAFQMNFACIFMEYFLRGNFILQCEQIWNIMKWVIVNCCNWWNLWSLLLCSLDDFSCMEYLGL